MAKRKRRSRKAVRSSITKWAKLLNEKIDRIESEGRRKRTKHNGAL